jgi:hypothetical protein
LKIKENEDLIELKALYGFPYQGDMGFRRRVKGRRENTKSAFLTMKTVGRFADEINRRRFSSPKLFYGLAQIDVDHQT